MVAEDVRGMSSGVAHAAFALWSVLAILCATVCGRMLMAAERGAILPGVARGCLFRPVGAAGRLDLLGGGVSEDVSYAVYQEGVATRGGHC